MCNGDVVYLMGNQGRVVVFVGLVKGIRSGSESWIESDDVISIVDVAFEHEAGEGGFETVCCDSGGCEIAVCGKVEVRGVEFEFTCERYEGAIDPEPELIIDVGEGQLVVAGLCDVADTSGDRFRLRWIGGGF